MSDQTENMQESAVAEALGVEAEAIQLPPGVRIGVTVFELEDGQYGFMPTNTKTTLMDVYGLLARIQAGIEAELAAQKIIEAQRAVAANIRAAQKPPSKIVTLRRD